MAVDEPVVVPPRKEGEDTFEYVDRLEWHRQKASTEPRVGYVATAKGFVHHSQAMQQGSKGAVIDEENGVEVRAPSLRQVRVPYDLSIFGDAPPPPKRSHQERLEVLVRLLLLMAEDSYKRFGRVILPRSVTKKIVEEYRAMGQIVEPQKIETMAINQVTEVLRNYAERMLIAAERGI